MATRVSSPGFDLSKGVLSRVTLNDGHLMPVLGLGVWQTTPGKATREAVGSALEVGYRLIDTAALYRNEEGVGEALRESGIPREEVFITTKLWNDDQGFESAFRAFERSRRALKVDYVDLYLIHWPVPGKREESWKALARLKDEGKCRSIGVSNYTINHLESLLRSGGPMPAVNQVEFSPFLYQRELSEYCRHQKIQVEAYSPLTRGRRLNDPVVQRVARTHQRSPAQVLIRWGLEHSVVEIPKSADRGRIRENAQVFDFALAPEEISVLDKLDERSHVDWDPTHVR